MDEREIVILEDDEGNEIEFEVLDVFEYEEKEYIVLFPVEDEAEDEGEVVILQLIAHEDTDEFVQLESEELLDKLFEVFKERYEASFEEEGEEE